jgi:gamma-glutamyltranspeptidase/glutathione hydrolase
MSFQASIRGAAVLLLVALVAFPLPAAAPRAPHGTGGAVVSDDSRATAVGIEILEAGGNAVDAAVATALALAVVYPEAGNLGGGGFAVVRLPASPSDGRAAGGFELATLDFREEAPAAAARDMYLDAERRPVPEASLVGGLAVGVPGSPAGLHELHRRYGKLPWARVVAPAERLARDGFEVDDHLHARVAEARDLLARFPEAAAAWLPDGEPPRLGARLHFPDLAETLRAYAERGPKALTTGPVAARVAEVARRHGGILTAADLSGYRAVWRDPVTFEAFGWRFAGMDLPSSGTAILGEVFGVLERLGWPALPRFGADRAHLLAEAFRGAYADRFLLGDPATAGVAPADLLAPAWLDRRAAAIRPYRAAPSAELAPYPGARPRESRDTTHLSVLDSGGGAVALTTTLNALFGSGVWVPGFGFLNDEMDDFTTAPGEPNLFGLVQGEANAVRPGARMLSSMCPTIGWRERPVAADGEAAPAPVLIAIGGRGGSRIPTNTAQVLLAAIVDGDHLQLALDRPRLHHQWLPDRLQAEPDALAPETRAVLLARGHEIVITDETARVNAAAILADGTLEAASDPRGTGTGAVVTPASPPQQ